jgi:hypothetical protein
LSTLVQIITLCSALGTYADNALGPNELDVLVGHGARGVALGIRLDVAEVTNVAVLVARGAVGLVVGVDYAKSSKSKSRKRGVEEGTKPSWPRNPVPTVRASRGAAIGVVTKGVDVHATLGVGIVAGNVPSDSSLGRLVLLLEDDRAGNLGVTTDDSD